MSAPAVGRRLRLSSSLTNNHHSTKRQWTCPSCRVHAAALPQRLPTRLKKITRYSETSFSQRRSLFTSLSTNDPETPDVQSREEDDFSSEELGLVRALYEDGLASPRRVDTGRLNDTHGIAEALRSGDVVSLQTALSSAAEDPGYITSIPKSTWTEIFGCFNPVNILPGLHRIHQSFNEKQLMQTGVDVIERRKSYLESLAQIIGIRKTHGIHMDIIDYRMLLRYAARVGDERTAQNLWSDMKKDGVLPDVLCYNAYMEAVVWDEDSRLRQQRRARRPFQQSIRKSNDISFFKPGVSELVTQVYSEMVSRKVSANTDTLCVVMMALARDGLFKGVQSIMSKAWGVDAETLMNGIHPTHKKDLRHDSPTYPNSRLLTTTAEIYGMANRMPEGMRLIDYLSNTYHIEIGRNVWYQILRWTWLQSRLHEQDRIRSNPSPVKLANVQHLSNVMVQQPYEVLPGMQHLDILFRSASVNATQLDERPRIIRLLSIFEMGRLKYLEHLKTQRQKNYEHHKSQTQGVRMWNGPHRPNEKLRKAADDALIKKRLSHQLLLRWTRKLISLNTIIFPEGWRNAELKAWRLRGMQQFLYSCNTFAPSSITYRIETGVVELEFRTAEEVYESKRRKAASDLKRFRSQSAGEKKTSNRWVVTLPSSRMSSKAHESLLEQLKLEQPTEP